MPATNRTSIGPTGTIRTANPLAYLQDRRHPALLLVGEAAGYHGCRFSGIAFTSERSFAGPQRTSTRPEGWQEPSATVVHGELASLGLEGSTVLWNVVPFHPARAHGRCRTGRLRWTSVARGRSG